MGHTKEKRNQKKLPEKAFQSALINIFQEVKETMSEESKQSMEMMFHHIKNINRKVEILYKIKLYKCILNIYILIYIFTF